MIGYDEYIRQSDEVDPIQFAAMGKSDEVERMQIWHGYDHEEQQQQDYLSVFADRERHQPSSPPSPLPLHP